MTRRTGLLLQPKSVGDTQKLQAQLDALQSANKELQVKLSATKSRRKKKIDTVGPSTSQRSTKTTSVDLHWDEEGLPMAMSKDKDPIVSTNWKFQKIVFL